MGGEAVVRVGRVVCIAECLFSEVQCMGVQGAKETYEPSVQVKTRENPQERTWASASLRDGRCGVVMALKTNASCDDFEKKVFSCTANVQKQTTLAGDA